MTKHLSHQLFSDCRRADGLSIDKEVKPFSLGIDDRERVFDRTSFILYVASLSTFNVNEKERIEVLLPLKKTIEEVE